MRRLPLVLVALLVLLSTAACSKDDVDSTRAKQIRAAATKAGLKDDVIDVLVLASKGPNAPYQLTYPGEGSTELVVSQTPGRHRVDVVSGGRIVQSDVVRNGTAYSCTAPKDDAKGALVCKRTTSAAGNPAGVFDAAALATFTKALADAKDDATISVETRDIAGVHARCIRSRPKPGPTNGTGPTSEELCLSPEGAPLLIDAGTDRLEARAFTTKVPSGTFDV